MRSASTGPSLGPPPDPRNGNPLAKIRIRCPPRDSNMQAKPKSRLTVLKVMGHRITNCYVRREDLGFNADLPITAAQTAPPLEGHLEV